MAKPFKDFRLQRNGDSLQLFKLGEYVGSIPLSRLYYLINEGGSKDTNVLTTQPDFITKSTFNAVKDTKQELAPKEPDIYKE